MPAGRPSTFTMDIAEELCARIAQGNSLSKVCEADDMPTVACIYKWFGKYPELVELYARAKEDSADADQDRLDQIAEKVLTGEYEPQQARVAADIIKWSASKKRPKKYGDRQTIEHEVSSDMAERLQRGRKRCAERGQNSSENNQ